MQLLTVQQSNTGVKGMELPLLAAKSPVVQLHDSLGPIHKKSYGFSYASHLEP